MMYLQNLHTHSKYCDGNNSLEKIVITAIEKGFDSIGFSDAEELLKYCGFKESYVLTENGFEPVIL